jgi:hypothetical protein
VTVSGAGLWRQAAYSAPLFYDGFESGGLTSGGWVATTNGTPPPGPDPTVITRPPAPGVGTRVLNMNQGDTWYENWVT